MRRTKKLSEEEFVERLSINFPEYELVGNYVNIRTNVLLRCKIHDVIFEANPHSILLTSKRKTACPECKMDNRKRHFFEYISENYPNIEVVGEYVDYKTPIELRCKIHPNERIYIEPRRVVGRQLGDLCPFCRELSANLKKFSEWIEKFSSKFPESDLDFTSSFWTTKHVSEITGKPVTRIENIRCKKCGEVFAAYPNRLLNNGRCPKCTTRSNGEILVEEWFIEHNINFDSQVYFQNSIIVGRKEHYGVIVDFIAHYNGLDYPIECNGEHHYVYCPRLFDEIESFECQLRRDNNVRQYFSDQNNTVFVEIPWKYYSKEKIDALLTKIILENSDPQDIIEIPEIRYTRRINHEQQ